MSEKEKNKSLGRSDSDEKPLVPKGKNYLLVIGIDQYTHCPRLYNAVKDAKDIVSLLKKRFEFDTANIRELYDEEATKRNIFKSFEFFAEKITPSDNLVIFFSGHGEYKKLFNIGYWIPVEAEKEAVDQYIPNSVIKNILGAIRSHHTFLMVDSCFSGALFAKGANRNISLRKERDPSRWGLTAGRNEIVTDGAQGTNSPFAKSILYQLENTNRPLGVAELCDKVLEVVSANADQTPRGEPLKVEGHQGGQFVFHLKRDILADWKDALATNNLAAYQAFLSKYPEDKYSAEAKAKIKTFEANALWHRISQTKDDKLKQLNTRLRLVNQYVDLYQDQKDYQEALNIGELLDYKKQFFLARDSEFSLRKFVDKHAPDTPEASAIRKEAEALILQFDQPSDPEPIIEHPKKKDPVVPIPNPLPPTEPGFLKKYGKYLPLLLIPFLILGIWRIWPGTPAKPVIKGLKSYQDTKTKLWGFKKSDIIVIRAQYDKVTDFNNGEAKVLKDRQSFIINEMGKCIKNCPTNPGSNSFRDTRDGKTYKWVKLKDGKKWMVQNLDFKTPESWCFENNSNNCRSLGRLYSWKAAQRACPPAWRLPSDNDWWNMARFYGRAFSKERGNSDSTDGQDAYRALLGRGVSNFAIVPGGGRNPDGSWQKNSEMGAYWTTKQHNAQKAIVYQFDRDSNRLNRLAIEKTAGVSCRCIQD